MGFTESESQFGEWPHKGASSISFACVFAIDSSCTDEGIMEDSAHVGPFTKLGLRLGESLDSYSKTILVPSSTFRSVLDLGRWWRNEVRIFAADVKEARAFAVFWSQTTKAIPDINKSSSISDNSSIMALIVGTHSYPSDSV